MLKWTLVFLAGALLGANAVYFAMTRDTARPPAPMTIERKPAPPAQAPPGTPTPPVSTVRPPERRPERPESRPSGPPAPAAKSPAGLLMPVRGIAASQISDTYGDARGGDRAHEALDIMAPRGTPVLAVSDGHVEKLFYSKQGGLTVYQFEPAGIYVYYYAHLERYAPGVVEGKPLRRGEVIGYVGSSGNADAAAPHLHFAVFLLGPEKQWWKGTPINPYPLLARR